MDIPSTTFLSHFFFSGGRPRPLQSQWTAAMRRNRARLAIETRRRTKLLLDFHRLNFLSQPCLSSLVPSCVQRCAASEKITKENICTSLCLSYTHYYSLSSERQTSPPPPPPPAAMASYVESGWQYLITHFSDFQLACIGSFILHESVFFLSGLPFIYLERRGYFRKYKIQDKVNAPAAQDKCIRRLVLYHLCVNLPVMIFSYPVFRFMGMKSSLPLPSWKVVLSQILFYFILEDFVFYWGHRVLHTKWLYQHVHSIHHEYATPFGLTSEYAHPAEILFLGFATIVGPALTGPHLVTLWLWMVVRVLETVEAHCGYHFPWSPSNFIPLYGGADFHDYHHRLLYTKSGNYSSTFMYMDRIFGTDKGYQKLKALKNHEDKDSKHK